MACHFMGDADSARHLGYYAELRAAIAILAGAGVAVLNNPHFVIDTSGKAVKVSGNRTHVMTWLALEHWANSTDAASVLGDVLTPEAIPIGRWVQAIPGGSAWQPIGKDWLLSLGLDLKYFAEDRDARNHASYRPTHLPEPCGLLDAVSTARFGLDLWSMLEPSTYRAFDLLDLHFLRQTLELAFRSVRGRTARQAPKRYEMDIDAAVKRLVAPGPTAEALSAFLQRKREPKDAAVLSAARRNASYRAPEHHVQVMSRAALLLRVATGATKSLLEDAGIAFEDVAFWWGRIGGSRGLWDEVPEVEALPDLWASVEEALKTVADWADGREESHMELRAGCADPLSVLGGAEIVGIWGLAS